jgi:hypothetical protein
VLPLAAGLGMPPGRGVLLTDPAPEAPGVPESLFDGVSTFPSSAVLSANLFSNVPRSVAPASSSDRRPDKRKRDSMRPRRFSSPSIYFALQHSQSCKVMSGLVHLPFWWVALLLHLSEYTLGLVILAVCTGRHLTVALDLLLSTHVASLCLCISIHFYVARRNYPSTYPRNPSPFWVPVVSIVHSIPT